MDYRSPTDHTVQANGLRLHYLAWGDPAAPPLVLLHGAGNTAHTWDFCAPSLAERYWVLALDLRGHGESDWASDYSWSARVADTVAFLHALGRSRAALMGLSLGGMTAYMTAAQHPEVV
ncbi:MAG: alpha/beta fold hydrolase [Meiothermus silvanus]|nr:alpha/beta fold hydrolase [Allomeiothermus silvanus]